MHLTINQVQTERKRLDGCVLMLPKWTKTQERLEICTCGPLKIDNRAADTTITVESAQENDRPCHNAKLLGKYRVNLDLSRFDAAPLIAFTATKEMKGAMCAIGSSTMASGTETDGRIPARCGADRTGQRTDA
jgi:hypothetical protein